MALEDDIKEIKSGINDLKGRSRSVGRTGLYFMMMITRVSSVKTCSCDDLKRILMRIKSKYTLRML